MESHSDAGLARWPSGLLLWGGGGLGTLEQVHVLAVALQITRTGGGQAWGCWLGLTVSGGL